MTGATEADHDWSCPICGDAKAGLSIAEAMDWSRKHRCWSWMMPAFGGAVDAHCLACHAATPAAGSVLIARAMTVQASKYYAALHYRAELDEYQR